MCGTNVEVWKAAAYCVECEVREELVGVVANARSVSGRCTMAVGSVQT